MKKLSQISPQIADLERQKELEETITNILRL